MPAKAVAMISGPRGSAMYIVRMEPSPRPSKPVMAKRTPIPALELAVRGRTNMPITMAPITDTRYIQLGRARDMEITAIRALKPRVADSSI